MHVELVRTSTRDSVRLDGVLQIAPRKPQRSLGLDALLCVHGTGGSFYSSPLLEHFSNHFTGQGVHVLRVNTRGHDGISTAVTPHGGRRQGAAFEVVDDCRNDLAAWVDWLSSRGRQRIGLLGHSLGAVKCVYALARDDHSAIARLIALSPPRLSHDWFCSGEKAQVFRETFEMARRYVHSGRPDTLIEVGFPLPMIISAAGYIEKYGPEERYNVLDYLDRLPCPALFTYGTVEMQQHVAFTGMPDAIHSRAAATGMPVEVRTISAADHFYTGEHDRLADVVTDWLGEEK